MSSNQWCGGTRDQSCSLTPHAGLRPCLLTHRAPHPDCATQQLTALRLAYADVVTALVAALAQNMQLFDISLDIAANGIARDWDQAPPQLA